MKQLFIAILAAGAWWLGIFSSPARVVTIGVGGGSQLLFFPATTNINVNDQVIWIWNSSGIIVHSTTSDTNGLWDSSLAAAPHAFTNTFNSAGTFPFHCTHHEAMGMTGTIFVAAPNVPPTVAITNPAAGMVFSEPATIKLAATAADADGAVTNIQFFQGALSLTNLAGGPFLVSVSNLAAGSYVFTAVASDNGGLTATNAITNSVVTPVPVAINSPSRLLPSGFQFNYSANVGLRYIVQSSTSLLSTNWLTLATNTAAASPVIFMDANTTSNPGFYRVGLLPNP